MLKGAPDTAYLKEAAAAGLAVPAPALVPLWAQHVQVVELFTAMRTQWVFDAHGRPSLNYVALPVVEQRLRIGQQRSRALFPDLRVMEAEGRNYWLQQAGQG